MKHLLIGVLTIFSLAAFAAGEKVLESSSRKAPDWVYGMASDYIITTAEGSTMEIARTLAMQAVKERIVSSVAEHVEAEVSMLMKETTTDSDISAYTDFSKQIRSKSADIPFINNISEANVEDYYWEKVQLDKKTIVYRYNIKYPFSSLQIRLIISDFKKYQEELKEKARTLEYQISNFASDDFTQYNTVEEMLSAVNKLELFIKSLPQDDTKNSKTCAAIMQNYKKMISSIQVRTIEVTREYADIELYYGSKRITYDMAPKMSSNCLTELSYIPKDNCGRITYNFEYGCYEDEQNSLNITYTIIGKKINHTLYIK
jgi:hypothetical protein